MNQPTMINLLLAMRAQLQALEGQVEAILALVTEDAPPRGCQHPAQAREDLSTFGSEREHWICKNCGHEEGGTSGGEEAAV